MANLSSISGNILTSTTLDWDVANSRLGIGVAPSYKLDVNGDARISTIANATTDTDKFLVSDSGVIKYRTGAELLADIGASVGIGGSGTADYVPKFTGSTTIGNSIIRVTGADATYFSTYKGANSDGSNLFIGGGGQSSIGDPVDTYFGSYNTSLGINSLNANTTGYSNSTFGQNSLNANTTGFDNSAFGVETLFLNTTGYQNSAFGNYSLFLNTSGYENTSVGFYSLNSNTTGYSNSALGSQSFTQNTTGYSNVAVGAESLYANTTGNQNTAIGYYAGNSAVSSLKNTTGSNNIFIGYNSIGVDGTQSNRTWIGNSSTTSSWLAGNLLLGSTTDGGQRLQVTGTSLLTGSATITGSTTASSAIARGTNITSTLVASANNDVLVGLDINPTFTNGAFTGVTNAGIRTTSNIVTTGGNMYVPFNAGYIWGALGTATTYISSVNGTVISMVSSQGQSSIGKGLSVGNAIGGLKTGEIDAASYVVRSAGGSYIGYNINFDSGYKYVATGYGCIETYDTLGNYTISQAPSGTAGSTATLTNALRIFNNGNIGINTTTDAGYKLDVQGTLRTSGDVTIGSAAQGQVTLGKIFMNYPGTITYSSAYVFSIDGSTSGSGSVVINGSYLRFLQINHGLEFTTTVATKTFLIKKQQGGADQTSYLDISGSDQTNVAYAGKGGVVRIYGGLDNGITEQGLVVLAHNGTSTQGSVIVGGTSPSASALFQINSTTKGFLPPRMTSTQRDAISTPATGLEVFNTTTNTPSIYNGTNWQNVIVPNSSGNVLINTTTDAGFRLDVNGTARVQGVLTATAASTHNFTQTSTNTQNIVSFTYSPNTGTQGSIYLDGSGFGFTNTNSGFSTMYYLTGGNIRSYYSGNWRHLWSATTNVLNDNATPTAVSTAILALNSTTRGFLPPVMTSTQRDAISTPAAGLVAYQSTNNALSLYNGTAWSDVLTTSNYDGLNIAFGTTTGTKIGTATSQKIGFFNATPVVQRQTTDPAATRVAGGGNTITDTDTFDGYTVATLVKALRDLGLLA